MPNWTSVGLRSENLSKLDIWSLDEYGKKILDYNKIVPMPDYVRDTISPVDTDAILCYLFTKYPEKEARKIFKETKLQNALIKKTVKEILAEVNTPVCMSIEDDSDIISAYELGKNYLTAHERTGCWDWYNWALENWGVKWNASSSYLDEVNNYVNFEAPWFYPDSIFRALAKQYPLEHFEAEIIYEEESDKLYRIKFSDTKWEEEVEDIETEEDEEEFEFT